MKQPNRITVKETAKEILKGNMWNLWKPLLIVALISFVVTLIVDNVFTETINCPDYGGLIDSSLLEGYTCTQVTTLGRILNIAHNLFNIVVGVGVTAYTLKVIRKEKFDLKEDLLKYFKENLGLCLLTGILVSIFTILWSFLLIIPGIIASISYVMWKPLIVDGSTGALDTIKKSKKIMYGHKGNYFVFILSFLGWILLGVVTLGIALIYVIPYMSVAQLVYYEEIKKIEK